MPRANTSSSKPRHTPLHVSLDQDAQLAKFGRVSRGKKSRGPKGDGSTDDAQVEERTTESSRMSRKILDLARDQQTEISKELGGAASDEEDEGDMSQSGP